MSCPTKPGWWWRHEHVEGATSYRQPIPVYVHDLTGELRFSGGLVRDDGWWVRPLEEPPTRDEETQRLAALSPPRWLVW